MSEFRFELDDTKRLAERAERFIEVFSRMNKEIAREENLDFAAIQKLYLQAFGDAFDSPCVLLLRKVSEDRVEVVEIKESEGVQIKKGEQLKEEGFIKAVFEKEKDYMSMRCLEESDPLAQKGISSCCAICYQYRGEKWLMLLCNWSVDKKTGDAIESYGAKLAEIAMNLLVTNEKLQNQLIQSEKQATLSMLAGAVAHQIRNPLTGIALSLRALKRLMPSMTPEIEKRIKNIESEGDRAGRVVDNFLDFSRPSSKTTISKEDVNLILRQTVELVKDSSLFQNIKIILGFNPLLPKISVNIDQFKGVFLNFILNAQESMLKGGVLRITTSLDKEFVEIAFSDTGPGISTEEKKELFDPFYTTKSKGVGLGLAIAKRIIEEHNGSIKVESKIGEGTTFIIKLPIKGGK